MSSTSRVTALPPADAAVVPSPVATPGGDPLRLGVRLAPLLALGIAAGLIGWGLHSGVLSSLANLQAFIGSLGVWGPIAFLVICTALVVFPVVPGGLAVIAAPVLFGPLIGTLYTYIAVCSGLLVNFTIGRYVGLGLIERLFAPRSVEKLLGWTRRRGFTRAFAVAMALPVAPDDLLCYLAGTTRMRWSSAAVLIVLCKPWSLLLYGLGVSALVLQVLPW